MKLPLVPTPSLRTRFILGMAAMLLPLALLGAVTFFSVERVTGAVNKIAEDPVREMHAIIHLQVLVLQAAMPPNDYLINGDRSEHDKFLRLSVELGQALDNVLALPTLWPEQQALMRSVRHEWLQARAIAETLLARTRPVGDPAAVREMERMDAGIDRAVAILQQVHGVVHQKVKDYQAQAQAVERHALFLLAVMFGLGLAIAGVGGIMLARSILVPLRALEESANRLGAGELSHRVRIGHVPNDLGKLAAAFDAMAEKLQRSQSVLEELSSHDGLTGLYNHRAFFTLLDDELAHAQRFNRSVSLLMFDIDHFKDVNDTHGHLAGDGIIKALSELLSSEARAVDRVCRYGGEEITFILPETSIETATDVAERLRAAVEAQLFKVNAGVIVRITVSVGVASWPAQAGGAQALVAAADAALYVAKQSGRNRVVCQEPAPGRPVTRE